MAGAVFGDLAVSLFVHPLCHRGHHLKEFIFGDARAVNSSGMQPSILDETL